MLLNKLWRSRRKEIGALRKKIEKWPRRSGWSNVLDVWPEGCIGALYGHKLRITTRALVCWKMQTLSSGKFLLVFFNVRVPWKLCSEAANIIFMWTLTTTWLYESRWSRQWPVFFSLFYSRSIYFMAAASVHGQELGVKVRILQVDLQPHRPDSLPAANKDGGHGIIPIPPNSLAASAHNATVSMQTKWHIEVWQ